MLATPECFAHLTQLLQVLAGGRVCAVLEVTAARGRAPGQRLGYWRRLLPCGAGRPAWGPDRPACRVSASSSSSQGGYHLESLSQSVCMTVRALLGDPALPLSGPMEPHGRCGTGRKEGGKGRGGRPGLLILLLLAAPWSPSSVCGQPRPLTG